MADPVKNNLFVAPNPNVQTIKTPATELIPQTSSAASSSALPVDRRFQVSPVSYAHPLSSSTRSSTDKSPSHDMLALTQKHQRQLEQEAALAKSKSVDKSSVEHDDDL